MGFDIGSYRGTTTCVRHPAYTFRLPAKQRRRLEETAAIFGAGVPAFLRGLIGTIVEAESIEARQFRERLQAKLLARAVSEAQMPLRLSKVVRKRRGRVREPSTR